MSHYAPRRGEDDRWRYTNQSARAGIYAIGYCVAWRDLTPEERKRLCISDAEWRRLRAHRGCYHGDGHATKEEALGCYRRFLLDNAVELDVVDASAEGVEQPCVVCAVPTSRFAAVGGHARFWLCDAHRTLERVAALFDVEPAGDAAAA